MVQYHGHEQVKGWHDLAKAADFRALAAQLVSVHYDPRYAKTGLRQTAPLATLSLAELGEETLADAAAHILSVAG